MRRDRRRVVLTHGCSLSNLPLFVAEGAGLFAAEGLEVEVPRFTTLSSTADLLDSGAADLGTVAFTEPLIDAQRPDPPIIVAGSGLMGIALLAQPGTSEVVELRGRAVGTFRRDPLEVLLHDALVGVGLEFAAVEVHYLDEINEALQAFENGTLDAITVAEPHATRVRRMGGVDLSDGTELWGDPFPDTVLVAPKRLLADEPEAVAATLRAMRRAEAMIVADPKGVLEHVARHYPEYSQEELEEGAPRQPPRIDIRPFVDTILDRWASLQSLGLVPHDAIRPDHVFDLELLVAELHRDGPVG